MQERVRAKLTKGRRGGNIHLFEKVDKADLGDCKGIALLNDILVGILKKES